NRSWLGSGVKEASVRPSGSGGACGTPLLVMNAKLAGSTLTLLRQSALLFVTGLLFWSRLKLKMAMAAHHLVASQLMASWNGAQPVLLVAPRARRIGVEEQRGLVVAGVMALVADRIHHLGAQRRVVVAERPDVVFLSRAARPGRRRIGDASHGHEESEQET